MTFSLCPAAASVHGHISGFKTAPGVYPCPRMGKVLLYFFLDAFFHVNETEKNIYAAYWLACLFFESTNWCNFIASVGFWCVSVGVCVDSTVWWTYPTLSPSLIRPNCLNLCNVFSLSVKSACQGRECVVRILSSITRQSTELSQFHSSGSRSHQWSPLCLDPIFATSFRLGAGSVDYCI